MYFNWDQSISAKKCHVFFNGPLFYHMVYFKARSFWRNETQNKYVPCYFGSLDNQKWWYAVFFIPEYPCEQAHIIEFRFNNKHCPPFLQIVEPAGHSSTIVFVAIVVDAVVVVISDVSQNVPNINLTKLISFNIIWA